MIRQRPRHDQGAGLPALHGLPEAGPSLRIPGYRIVRTLGQGGNASVFLASQAGHGRDVALKVMAPALTDDPERIAGFLREGQISAGLLHPNLAQVFAVGAHGGTCFLAAEYLPGGSLRARIRRGMGVGEALDCAVDVARGLQYLHRKGFVHGDVKPENILFRADGTAVLSDFGIARAAKAARAASPHRGELRGSDLPGSDLPGAAIGTPAYMSPEQARGEALDGRSDLYSLGVVLHEMLTGALPYAAADASTLALAHESRPMPQLPRPLAWLQPLLDGLMAKEPALRTGSGEEFVRQVVQLLAAAPEAAWIVALDAADAATGPGAVTRLHRRRPPPPWRRRRVLLLVGFAVLVLLAAALAGWIALR